MSSAALFLCYVYSLVPHSGQNFVPAGTAVPQFPQKLPAFCFAPHSGQNLEPAAIAAPQAEHTAVAAAAGAGLAAEGFMLCVNIYNLVMMLTGKPTTVEMLQNQGKEEAE